MSTKRNPVVAFLREENKLINFVAKARPGAPVGHLFVAHMFQNSPV